ncbi:hypothetical protein J1605_011141 [Eschrichtius robustus]|uniref:Small ribosomal subunit protein uS15 N-terminal domain-containing protein n=1 Tax=Eschrichtius robustus TaxID=9764 RepID=A0AB34GKU7_ESCRO|nr:hypothetical protein J1605_011141 [Eschrichtius robustus]
MQAPGKGLSQSALAYHRSNPTWLKLTSDNRKEQIYKLAKKGLPQGDPERLTWCCFMTGNKILRILKSKGLPPDSPEYL